MEHAVFQKVWHKKFHLIKLRSAPLIKLQPVPFVPQLIEGDQIRRHAGQPEVGFRGLAAVVFQQERPVFLWEGKAMGRFVKGEAGLCDRIL